jgi:hypothetical protein
LDQRYQQVLGGQVAKISTLRRKLILGGKVGLGGGRSK